MEPDSVSVRIEQPTVNKVTVFLVAGLAIFITLVLWSKIEAGEFTVLLLVFVVAVVTYAYRSIQIVAIADADGIDVRNLVRHRHFDWQEVDALSVGKGGKGAGTGITVEAVDGSTMPIEASWGPWYQGKVSDANTLRCDRIIQRIEAMRAHRPVGDDISPIVDPVVVRETRLEDVDTVARALDAAWRETYVEILPSQTFEDRDPADDAEMLRSLLSGSVPGSGSLLVEHLGEVVGASVFGPTGGDGLVGFAEVYMIYVRAGEIGRGAGRRLAVRTWSVIRASGARGIVGHVYVNNRPIRNSIERMGIEAHGQPQEQLWHGLPVRVLEYRLPLTPDT